jgi:hypothetical protein
MNSRVYLLLHGIDEEGVDSISYRDLCRIKEAAEVSKYDVFFTFDDARLSIVEPIINLFSDKIDSVYVCPIVNRIDTHGYANWGQIRVLSSKGVKIVSHSMSHENLRLMSYEQQNHEMLHSIDILSRKLGISVQYFAVPLGEYDSNTVLIAKKQNIKLLVSDFGVMNSNNNVRILRVPVHKFNVKECINLLEGRRFAFSDQLLKQILKKTLRKIIGYNLYSRLRNIL